MPDANKKGAPGKVSALRNTSPKSVRKSEPVCSAATPEDQAPAAVRAEIAALRNIIFDAQARRRIVDHWLLGWIVGDDAMELLVTCDLIEFSPEAVL